MSGAHFREIGPAARAAAGLVVAAAAVALLVVFAPGLGGPPLLDVRAPTSDATVGFEGVEVLIRFDPEHADHDTFRVLLNGADVTAELEVAANGVHGTLHGLLEGDNQLSFEVDGTADWPIERDVHARRAFTIRYRPPQSVDRG